MPQTSITKYYTAQKNSVVRPTKRRKTELSEDNVHFVESLEETKLRDSGSEYLQKLADDSALIKDVRSVQNSSPKRHATTVANPSKIKRSKSRDDGNNKTIQPEQSSARKKLILSHVKQEKEARSGDDIRTVNESYSEDKLVIGAEVNSSLPVEEILRLTTEQPPARLSPLPVSPVKKNNSFQRNGDNSVNDNGLTKDVVKKMSPEEIKQKLGNGGLKELQRSLATVNNCSKQVKNLLSAHPCSPTKSLLLSPKWSPGKISPIASPRKLCNQNSPIKRCLYLTSERGETTCSQVVDEVVVPSCLKVSKSLSLPKKYSLLNEIFRCVDIVVSILYNRDEISTFSKIKPGVEQMMRKAFHLSHFGQLTSIFPLAYFFKQEKVQNNINKTNNYELTVTPNLKATADDVVLSPGHLDNVANGEVCSLKNQDNFHANRSQKMNPSCLLFRRSVFHYNLLEVVKKHHQNFLLTQLPPIHLPNDKLTKWHPKFAIEDVTDVPVFKLPQPPTVKTYDTAKDVLQKATSILGSNTKVEKALESVVNQNNIVVSSTEKLLKKTSENDDDGALKGVCPSLLAKIRAKEAAKVVRDMTTDPMEMKKTLMKSRFPDFIRIIRAFFISEKKAAIPIDSVINKLSESYRSGLAQGEIEEHLQYLSSILPTWITVHKVRKGVYVKVNKSETMNDLFAKIKASDN